MKKNFLFLLLTAMTWLMGTPALAQDGPSIEQDAEGYYLIGNASDLEAFSEWLSGGGDALLSKVKLTADIDLSGYEHRPIGPTEGFKYNGTFDGQGHRILNMVINNPDNNLQGFFGALRGGTIIRNLIIDKSCSVTGKDFVGGFCGMVQTSNGPVTFENCINEATVHATNGSSSGFIGAGKSGYPAIVFRNCVNTGNISASGKFATAFCSWINAGGSKMQNCLNLGIISNVDNSGGKFAWKTQLIRFEPNTLTMENVFDFSQTPEEDRGQGVDGEWSTDDPLQGELCYTLNGDQSTISWYQRIGKDAYPIPFYIEGGQVYLNSAMGCDGKPLGEASYSNNKTGDIPPHQYEDGICIVCDHLQPDYAPVEEGFYMLSNASQLYWFSMQVNVGKNYGWNAKLTSDLDMTDYEGLFTGLGDAAQGAVYQGTFDGQGHVISNLHINASNNFTGFVGQAGNGLVVKNMVLDETCSISGGECAALVGGANQMSGTVTLLNLGNMGNVYSTSKQAAGIFGGNAGSKATLLVENCFSTGAIEGTDQCAALIGWAGSNGARINNSWSCSEVTGNDKPEMYLSRGGTVTNSYCAYGSQTPTLETDDIESGALAYRINQNAGETLWYQNLDNGQRDYNPYPFAMGHAQVYSVGAMKCDGTVIPGQDSYSNDPDASVIPDHEYHDGFCSVCGHEDPDYEGFLAYITNPDFDVNAEGWVSEGTGLTVSNGVAEHYNHTFHTYQQIDTLANGQPLPNGVYKLRLQGFSRVRLGNDEEVYADGYLNNDLLRTSYFYAESSGKRVARRFMDITEDKQGEQINEGNGEMEIADGTFVPDGTAAYAAYFAKGLYWNKPLYLVVSDGTLRIGMCNKFIQTKGSTVWDRLRLEYVGNDAAAYALVAKQTAEEGRNFAEYPSQKPLVEQYMSIVEKAGKQTDQATILSDAHLAAILPDSIITIAGAYVTYVTDMDKLVQEVAARTDLKGDAAELLKIYLENEEYPCEEYPNGSYPYIKLYRPLNAEGLNAEVKFAKDLYTKAVAGSVEAGSDVTALLANADWNDPEEWAGWTNETVVASGGNQVYRGVVPDVSPVVAIYNTTFDLHQQVTGLKNGLYELKTNGWYRPGQGGEGDQEGYDLVPAEIYLNEFTTPLQNVWSDPVEFDAAVNGVNCRYDATNDPSAPHNGQETSRVDRNIGWGYIPDDAVTGAFAFHGDRYKVSAYAVVEDGKLTIGMHHLGEPWKAKNLSVWGPVRLIYHAQDAGAMAEALEHYSTRMERLEVQREGVQEYFYSVSHIDRIAQLINKGRQGDYATAAQAIKDINAELALIPGSHKIFQELLNLGTYLLDIADNTEDTELSNKYADMGYSVQDHAYSGDLTDEEAQALIDELMDDPVFGGVYVQGDLFDAESEDGRWDYKSFCKLYPLEKNAEGKYVGTVTLQNRVGKANADGRAGFYISRLNQRFGCAEEGHNFVTPAKTHFRVADGGQDFQALMGTYQITFDIDALTIDLKQQDEYEYNNQVFVTGTLMDNGSTYRWQKNEAVPLQHMGGGKYAGTVELILDNANPYCSFGIITCRSTEAAVNNSTTAMSSWTEARYGSEEQYLEIVSGQTVTDLVRGWDRTWRIAPAGKYLIEFDINNATMTPTLLETAGKGTEADPYLIQNQADLLTMQDKLVRGKTTYFRLEKDIDLAGKGWWPLNNEMFGNSVSETTNKAVSLDGNNHIITNLCPAVAAQNEFSTGMFGTLVGNVNNLGLFSTDVVAGNAANAGLLAGKVGYEGATIATTIDQCYTAGRLSAGGNAGGLVGTIESEASITNVYSVVEMKKTSDDVAAQGGLIGAVYGPLEVQYAYSASENAFIADEGTQTTKANTFAWDDAKADALAAQAAAWTAWDNNGKIGNGHPLLLWQVQRGDYEKLCGFYNTTGIESVQPTDRQAAPYIYNLAGQRQSKLMRGVNIVDGQKVLVK